jgi:SET domain-containing protein
MYEIKVNAEFGRGLYATRNIRANETIEVAEILVLSPEDTIKVNQTDLKYYTFVFNEYDGQDCLVLGVGELFNHAPTELNQHEAAWTSNVKYDLVRHGDRYKMVFVSIVDIMAGEQLFIDYNRDVHVDTTEYVNKNLVG